MKKLTSNKVSAISSPAVPIKKGTSAPGSPQKVQSTKDAKDDAVKGIDSQKQASSVSVQKVTYEAQGTSVSQKPNQTSQTGRKQSNATPTTQQESRGLFGFGGSKTETEKPVTEKMFGFSSSIFSSASTLIASAVQDESKTTPPISPKMQSAKQAKPPNAQKSEQDRKQEQPQQAKAHPTGQAKVNKTPSEASKTAVASGNTPTTDQFACPLCKMVLNMGSKDPPNYNICTECKSTVCNQCGFNPMPNVKEVR